VRIRGSSPYVGFETLSFRLAMVSHLSEALKLKLVITLKVITIIMGSKKTTFISIVKS